MTPSGFGVSSLKPLWTTASLVICARCVRAHLHDQVHVLDRARRHVAHAARQRTRRHRILRARAVDVVQVRHVGRQLVVDPHVARHRRAVVRDRQRVAQHLTRRRRDRVVRLRQRQVGRRVDDREVVRVVVGVVVVEDVGRHVGVVLEHRTRVEPRARRRDHRHRHQSLSPTAGIASRPQVSWSAASPAAPVLHAVANAASSPSIVAADHRHARRQPVVQHHVLRRRHAEVRDLDRVDQVQPGRHAVGHALRSAADPRRSP